MRRIQQGLQGFVILCLMTACGGAALSPSSGGDEIGFINQTNHSDEELRAIWKAAQQNIAQQVDLNPLQRSLYPGTLPHTLPGDSRALSIQPHQIAVQAEPDISSSKLFAETGTERADPTGLIACPVPCNVRYAAAFSFYQHPYTQYAASWEFQGNNFYQIIQYEFENHILNTLGYDMTWR